MKKILISFLICNSSFLICNSVVAQTLTQQVNASGGGYYQQINGSMQFTFGEPLTETYYSSTARLYNGFEQGSYVILAVDETPLNSVITANIFPIPTTGVFNILMDAPAGEIFEIKIIDALGKIILIKKINTALAERVDISGFSESIYFLQITNIENIYLKTYKIIKQ